MNINPYYSMTIGDTSNQGVSSAYAGYINAVLDSGGDGFYVISSMSEGMLDPGLICICTDEYGNTIWKKQIVPYSINGSITVRQRPVATADGIILCWSVMDPVVGTAIMKLSKIDGSVMQSATLAEATSGGIMTDYGCPVAITDGDYTIVVAHFAANVSSGTMVAPAFMKVNSVFQFDADDHNTWSSTIIDNTSGNVFPVFNGAGLHSGTIRYWTMDSGVHIYSIDAGTGTVISKIKLVAAGGASIGYMSKMSMDSNGNLLWCGRIDLPGSIQMPAIAKISSAGTIDWAVGAGESTVSGKMVKAVELSNGNIAAVGITSEGVSLIVLDQDGILLFARYINTLFDAGGGWQPYTYLPAWIMGCDMTAVQTGGFVLVGAGIGDPANVDTAGSDVLMMSFDNNAVLTGYECDPTVQISITPAFDTNLYFCDDALRSKFCCNTVTGEYVWQILSGYGVGIYYGVAEVLSGGAKIISFPGDPYSVNVTYDPLRYKAQGYFTTDVWPAGMFSYLLDSDTRNNVGWCGFGVADLKNYLSIVNISDLSLQG